MWLVLGTGVPWFTPTPFLRLSPCRGARPTRGRGGAAAGCSGIWGAGPLLLLEPAPTGVHVAMARGPRLRGTVAGPALPSAPVGAAPSRRLGCRGRSLVSIIAAGAVKPATKHRKAIRLPRDLKFKPEARPVLFRCGSSYLDGVNISHAFQACALWALAWSALFSGAARCLPSSRSRDWIRWRAQLTGAQSPKPDRVRVTRFPWPVSGRGWRREESRAGHTPAVPWEGSRVLSLAVR